LTEDVDVLATYFKRFPEENVSDVDFWCGLSAVDLDFIVVTEVPGRFGWNADGLRQDNIEFFFVILEGQQRGSLHCEFVEPNIPVRVNNGHFSVSCNKDILSYEVGLVRVLTTLGCGHHRVSSGGLVFVVHNEAVFCAVPDSSSSTSATTNFQVFGFILWSAASCVYLGLRHSKAMFKHYHTTSAAKIFTETVPTFSFDGSWRANEVFSVWVERVDVDVTAWATLHILFSGVGIGKRESISLNCSTFRIQNYVVGYKHDSTTSSGFWVAFFAHTTQLGVVNAKLGVRNHIELTIGMENCSRAGAATALTNKAGTATEFLSTVHVEGCTRGRDGGSVFY
jgi:hypothetical protein